jgi:hypothetical protein
MLLIEQELKMKIWIIVVACMLSGLLMAQEQMPPSPLAKGTTSSPEARLVRSGPSNIEVTLSRNADRARSDMRSLATGIESYYVDNNAYPPSSEKSPFFKPEAGKKAIPSFAGPQLTTPISYLRSLYKDPFSDQQPFGYVAINNNKEKKQGWLLFSPGPDGEYNLDWMQYDPSKPQPSQGLLLQGWDPTNGVMSAGDIWRIHQ